MIHLDCLSIHHVLIGSTIEVMRDGDTTTHVVAPGLATYLINRYKNHATTSVQLLNENGATQ